MLTVSCDMTILLLCLRTALPPSQYLFYDHRCLYDYLSCLRSQTSTLPLLAPTAKVLPSSETTCVCRKFSLVRNAATTRFFLMSTAAISQSLPFGVRTVRRMSQLGTKRAL